MGKFWSLLFLLVPILGVATFVAAPIYDHWLPPDVSEHGHEIDHLWTFILWLTGAVFVVTEFALCWFLWKYDGQKNRAPGKYTHGSHHLEVIWTVLPTATLLFIAIYQMNAWAEVKIDKPEIPPLVEVTARQFEWRLRYAGADQKLGTPDDVLAVNDMHIPVDTNILIELESQDVLHSFFLPNLRVKQDAVPGSSIPVWFRAKETGTFDLVCAELCGWGHYKMQGRLYIHEDQKSYQRWLDWASKRQFERGRETTTAGSK